MKATVIRFRGSKKDLIFGKHQTESARKRVRTHTHTHTHTHAHTHMHKQITHTQGPATQNAVCRSGLRSLSAAECYILSRLF